MKTGLRLDTKQWDGYLKKTAAGANKKLEMLIWQSTTNVSRNAKSFVTVKDSGLKQSIRYNHKKLTGVVEVGAEYGPYVEFGTGAKVNVPTELTTYAMQFKGRGIRKVNNRAQPYLYPALFLERVKFFEKLKNLI